MSARAQSVVRRLGWLLIAGGAALLGWFGWQVWATNWLSQRQHEEIVTALTDVWERPRDAPGAREIAGWPADQVTAIVRIPAFGDAYAVPVLEGVSDDVLTAGLGHFTETAAPGEVGNFALAGHRVTHGEPLRAMPGLEAGDEVVVETSEAIHTYVLDSGGGDLEVPFTQTWVIDPLPTNPRAGGVQPPQEPGEALITLTTCAELFHTDQRLIAFGHLVSTTPR